MQKKCLLSLAFAGVLVVPAPIQAQYADGVLSYTPGSGVSASFTNAVAALGAPTLSSTPFAPAFSGGQLVSIGAGGSLALELSTPIIDNAAHAYGLDFLVFGNSFFVLSGGNATGALGGNNTGSTRVEVSPDGLAWYTLNPLLAPTADGLFPTDGAGSPQIPVDPAIAGVDFAGRNVAGIRALYAGSAGGTGYDLAWAQDGNGNSVALSSASFVRIDVLAGKSEIDAIAVVPEPTTISVMLAAAGLLWGRLWKQTSAKRSGPRDPRTPHFGLGLLLVLAAAPLVEATPIQETFASDPHQDGWRVFGDTNLFRWNSTNQNLEVTWDSSRTNSYFYHPLGTILSRDDDFSIEFDLRLDDIGPGADANKTNAFELAVGLLNFDEASRPGFLRGTSYDSPDLFELTYFWDSGYGSTLSPAIVDTNSVFNWNGYTDYAIHALVLGDWYHVRMNYAASNQTLITTLTNAGQTDGVAITNLVNSYFTDFRVDTISISSYSDAGQDPQYGEGSILADGALDNFVVTVPPPPVQNFTGELAGGTWQCQFVSRSNWLYTLERSTDIQTWTAVPPALSGDGSNLFLSDTNPPPDRAYYRVRANRP